MAIHPTLKMVDWKGSGYFAFPDHLDPSDIDSNDPVSLWLMALTKAKRGNFELMPKISEFAAREQQPVLDKMSAVLAGDAGPNSSLASIYAAITSCNNFEIVLGLCDVMHARGLLADVPIMLDAFEPYYAFEDAEIIPIYLSGLLETEPGPLRAENFSSFPEYRAAVMDHYKQLADTLSSDQKLVLRGGEFSVLGLAKIILEQAQKPRFPMHLRRKFEASTGIDCTSMYSDRSFRPLSAAVVMESFLESQRAREFEHGARYFFGHRIPE